MKQFKNVFILILTISTIVRPVSAQEIDNKKRATDATSHTDSDYIFMADPFVLEHQGMFYLYGTRHPEQGIEVFRSRDLQNWEGPVGATDGFALVKKDNYGEKNFMGAYIVKRDKKFYFYYVATDRPCIAVATGQSPLGPFKQQDKKPLNIEGKSIAPHVFTDDDGKSYMYYTKLDHGNKIYVAQMEDDLLSIKEGTSKECIVATEPWEHTNKNPQMNWRVAEGAAVLKHKGTYYLFYTANHYRNPDYNVGYATSSSPTGPWVKYKGNPILKKSNDAVGMGSGEFIKNSAGELLFFYHAHYSLTEVAPRKVLYSKVTFIPDSNGGPDVVKVDDEKYFPQLGTKH